MGQEGSEAMEQEEGEVHNENTSSCRGFYWKDQNLDKAVAILPAGLTQALGKRKHWEESDEVKSFLQRTWPRIYEHKPKSAAKLLLSQAINIDFLVPCSKCSLETPALPNKNHH